MPEATPELRAAARALAIQECWRRGELSYKLHATQRLIYNSIEANKGAKRFFLNCSRRLGKSYMLTVMCIEQALRHKGSRILYLAPWSKDATDIVKDASALILADCPPSLAPNYSAQNREFIFRNGSIIRFKGTNGEHAQFLRGGAAHFVVLDECGLMDDFKHVVNDIVTPMTLTTNGVVIMATTPARTPGHESKEFCEAAFRDNCGYEFTLLDAPHLSTEQRRRALLSAGEAESDVPHILAGKLKPKSTTAKREYFAEWVTDASTAVIPEFDAQARAEIVREPPPRPPYFDTYVSMDPGFVDRTGILFGYYDVKAAKLVIEDEALLDHAGTPEIATSIRDKERQLWKDKQPYLRVSDVEKRLVSDLITEHQLPFSLAIKSDSQGSIWRMRQMVHSRQILIHPRCVQLIRQMSNCVWNKKASDFQRDTTADNIDGHFDLVAALKYLCRMVDTNRNPYPSWYREGPDTSRRARRDTSARKGTIRSDTPLSRRLDDAGK